MSADEKGLELEVIPKTGLPSRNRSYKRYVSFLTLFILAPGFLLALFNVIIDPYYVFGSPDISGINKVRPYYELHLTVTKPYQLRRLKPQAVILGSSRAEVGLDPNHSGWGDLVAFNFAKPASTSYETMLAFLHAQESGGPLRQAVAGLDFFSFNIFFKMDSVTDERRFSGNFEAGLSRFLVATLAERKNQILTRSTDPLPIATNNGGLKSIPPNWNEIGYLQAHPDVRAAVKNKHFTSGYAHYQHSGRTEGRLGGFIPSNWDEKKYLAANLGARAAVAFGRHQSGYIHFAAIGQKQELIGGFPPQDMMERLQYFWPKIGKLFFQLHEGLKLTLSSTTAYEALRTIHRQSEPASFSADGQRIWHGQQDVLNRIGGTGTAIQNYIKSGKWGLWSQPSEHYFCFSHPGTGLSTFDPFRYMVRQAYEHKADLRLFITPLHASVRNLIKVIGLNRHYVFWLRELVRINEEEAARAGRSALPIWDFSDINSVTSEQLPAAGDITPMRWFWEVSHYRQAAGDLILDRVLEYRDPTRKIPADFGGQLSSANIDTHLKRTKNGLTQWAIDHPKLASLGKKAAHNPKSSFKQTEAPCW